MLTGAVIPLDLGVFTLHLFRGGVSIARVVGGGKWIAICNKFVIIYAMQYEISFYDDAMQAEVFALPKTLLARFLILADRMRGSGPNLGDPHSKALGDGLLELRLKGAEGIARVMYCTLVGRRIVMLHSFIKKTDKIPASDMELARKRLKEIKNADV